MYERLTIKTDICIEPENEIVYHNPNDPEGMYNILDLAECLYSGGEAEAGILMEISRRLAAYEDSGLSPEHTHELAKAKAEGRLVVLPCNVGDTVYWADADGDEVLELPLMGYWVTVFSDGEKKIDGCVQAFGRNWSKPFGTCLFLTRAEAEEALKGAEHDRD